MVLQWELKLSGVEIKMRPGCEQSQFSNLAHKMVTNRSIIYRLALQKTKPITTNKIIYIRGLPDNFFFFLPDLVFFID